VKIDSLTPPQRRRDSDSNAGRDAGGSSGRPPPGERQPRFRLGPVVPFLIAAAFVVFIAHQEVPAVADFLERSFTPEQWQSKQTCREAALAELGAGQYARLLDGGEVHQTPDGPLVRDLRFAVLGEDDREQTVRYNCYLDANGEVFRLVRQ
jgi:hypothetical protein